MNRRKALAVAGTVVATAAAATLAMAANLGMLGFHREDATSIGTLTAKQPIELAAEEVAPTTTAPQIVVRYEDVYVPAPAAGTAAASDDESQSDDKDHGSTTTTTTAANEATPTSPDLHDDTVEHEDGHRDPAEAEEADD